MMMTRRRFLHTTGASVSAAMMAGAPYPAGARSPGSLRILCWEGYDSDAVLDPFRKSFDATVQAQRVDSDPEAVDRLRASGTKIWDLINVNNPWARNVMWPEGLIRERMLPRFRPPFSWATDETGKHLLGMAQRFGPFSFVVNTDRISRQLAEDQGFKLFLDPAMKGRFGILTYDNWNINHLCVAADVDPFKPKQPNQIDAFAETARRVFAGAAMLTDDMNRLNEALIDGTSVVAKPGSPRLAEAFLSYVQGPDVSKQVAFAATTHNPVAQMGADEVLAKFDRRELDALQWETLDADLTRCADFDINPDYSAMHPIYAALKQANKHKAR
jgi:spermidine/putrescine transport system substrate-binding protein